MLDLSNDKHVHVDQRLRSDLIIWLTTVRADGRPHTAAVWFLWDGQTFLIFSMPNQKVRNLRHNPNVMLALDDTKGGGDVITVEGTAELIEDPTISAKLPAYVQKYQQEMTQINLPPERMAQEYTQAIRITPTRLRTVQ
jgi:PPOX class probable F420-dependent enzyme